VREERRKARQEAGPATRTNEVSTPRGNVARKVEGDVNPETGNAK
jgi:hypothetical protein